MLAVLLQSDYYYFTSGFKAFVFLCYNMIGKGVMRGCLFVPSC